MKLDIDYENVVSTLSNIVNINVVTGNVNSTLFNVYISTLTYTTLFQLFLRQFLFHDT